MSNQKQEEEKKVAPVAGRGSSLGNGSLKMWIGVVLVVGAVGAFFGARPLWNYFEARKAVEIAGMVEEYLAAGDFQTAYREASRAYELAPEHPDVMRVLGKVLLRAGHSEQAIYFFKKLEEEGGDAVSDKVLLARALRLASRDGEANDLINEIRAEAPEDSELLALLASDARARGDISQASALSQRAAAGADSPIAKLEMAVANLSLPGVARRQAKEEIVGLMAADDGVGLRALEAGVGLSASGMLSLGEQQ